jgi:hypothetical protein
VPVHVQSGIACSRLAYIILEAPSGKPAISAQTENEPVLIIFSYRFYYYFSSSFLHLFFPYLKFFYFFLLSFYRLLSLSPLFPPILFFSDFYSWLILIPYISVSGYVAILEINKGGKVACTSTLSSVVASSSLAVRSPILYKLIYPPLSGKLDSLLVVCNLSEFCDVIWI